MRANDVVYLPAFQRELDHWSSYYGLSTGSFLALALGSCYTPEYWHKLPGRAA
jgi:hypothetical protein